MSNGNGSTALATSDRTDKVSRMPPWMEAMRRAVDEELNDEDMQAIVRTFVDKAKAGDEKAAKFVLEYLMGGKFAPQQVTINNFHGEPPQQPSPPAISATRAPTIRERVYDYLQVRGPSKPAVIAADLQVELKSVTGTLNHKWFRKSREGYEIAIAGA